MIRVLGPRMQHLRVGDELDVADFEDHVQGEALAGCFEHVGGFDLRGGERGDDALGGEPREGADVVGVPPGWSSG